MTKFSEELTASIIRSVSTRLHGATSQQTAIFILKPEFSPRLWKFINYKYNVKGSSQVIFKMGTQSTLDYPR
jgi:hypothetical protein